MWQLGNIRGVEEFVQWVDQLVRRFERIETVAFPRDRNDAIILDGLETRTESAGPE